MAKRGTNPVEEHVEKIVVGLSVLLFAFVVYSYVIVTPVTVSLNGQTVTPGELDRKLGEVAQTVADVYKSATWTKPTDSGQSAGQALDDLKKAWDVLNLPPPRMANPTCWWPEITKPEDSIRMPAKHGLAPIGAPTVSGVFSGVTQANLVSQPAPLPDPSVASPAAAVPAAMITQDVVWAFLRLNFDMQQQYEIFRQNNYTREQANLILIMEIQAQRQRVYPDGSTGSWEDVKSYKTVQVSYPQAVTVQEDGTLSHTDDQATRSLFGGLMLVEQNILYPLPRILGGDPFTPYGIPTPIVESASGPGQGAPAIVRPMPTRQPVGRAPRGGSRGGEGSSRGGEGPSRGGNESVTRGGPEGGAPRSAGPTIDKQALATANQALQQARKAFNERRYVEAKQALESVRGIPGLRSQVAELEQQINAAYTKWQETEASAAARKASEEARNAELWVYDMQAPAGKTYRYRARLVVFNVFAHPDSDRINELKNPQDGGRIALVGEWSAPSDPIPLADFHYFFFTGAASDKEAANVDIFRFQQGRWFKDIVRGLAIGDAIGNLKQANTGAGPVDVDYRTGCVVVDIGTDNSATVGTDTKGVKLAIKRQPSQLLVCMDAEGAIEPRWVAIDRTSALYKDLDAKVKAAVEPLAPTASGTPRMP